MGFQIQGISCHRIFVESVAKSKVWYQSLFESTPAEDLESFCAFDLAGVRLEIVQADAKNPVYAGGSVCYWKVDNLDAVMARVAVIGGKVYRGPLEVRETRSRTMQVQDPEGHLIGFEAMLCQ